MSRLDFRSISFDSFGSAQFGTRIPSSEESITPATNPNLILNNSIRLNPVESTVDNYYNGYSIELTRNLPNGKTHKQTRQIIKYIGSERRAVIDGVWDIDFEPSLGDNYKITLGEPDTRVSINPAMQAFDYITSIRYGRGLDPEKDFLLDTVKSTALKCDAKSDVSVKTITAINVYANDVFRYSFDGSMIWEGKVRQTRSNTNYVMFTSCLGKLTNKWNSWKTYNVGELIYHDRRFYRCTIAGAKASEPVHNTIGQTVNGLIRISEIIITRSSGGTLGPSTISLNLSKGNPILAQNAEGDEIAGYTLYDSDSIDYWRHLGWDEHSQSSVTAYQTNFTIDTSVPMFDNINMMFEHFNGIFVYSQGKYGFKLEEIESEYIPVTEDDIIGKISFLDAGSTKAFNSVTVSYTDPGNNFESRNISLFSESFLKQDRNVPKKGNITIVGCTNYYNVRLIADSFLKRSRRDSPVRLTLAPEFIILEPGSVIGITYKRYRWVNKPFRVDTLTIKENNLIEIVADEYDDSFYSLTNMNKVASVGARNAVSYTPLSAPGNLAATNTVSNNQIRDGVLLTWSNVSGIDVSTDIEIYCSDMAPSSLNVISISSNTLTFSQAHNFQIGDKIRALTSGNGLISGNTYFVIDTPTTTTARLSPTLNGSVSNITNGTSLNLLFDSFFLVGTISYPENQFLHSFPDITDDTLKYYKIRYKNRKQ